MPNSTFKRVDWRKVQTEDPFVQMMIDSANVMNAFTKRFPDRAESADDIAAVESCAAEISDQANKCPVRLRFTVVHSLLDALMA